MVEVLFEKYVCASLYLYVKVRKDILEIENNNPIALSGVEWSGNASG